MGRTLCAAFFSQREDATWPRFIYGPEYRTVSDSCPSPVSVRGTAYSLPPLSQTAYGLNLAVPHPRDARHLLAPHDKSRLTLRFSYRENGLTPSLRSLGDQTWTASPRVNHRN